MSKLIMAKTENLLVTYPDHKTGEVCEVVVVVRKVVSIETLDSNKSAHIIEIREDLLEQEA